MEMEWKFNIFLVIFIKISGFVYRAASLSVFLSTEPAPKIRFEIFPIRTNSLSCSNIKNSKNILN